MRKRNARLTAFTLSLHSILASLTGCAPATQQQFSTASSNAQGIAGGIQEHSSETISTQDPALAMQQRIAYYPSPWPQLSFLDQGSNNYKKLTGTLARLQWIASRNPSVREELPTILINAKSDCIDTPTLGLYKPSCKTIKIDYTDGQMAYEYPVEVEAVLAHEWGHHIATASGLNVSGTEHEIVADCFAGVVFGYYARHQLISESEGVKALQMMVQISNNSETGIHPNMQNRTSAFMGGFSRIADPQGEWSHLYGSTCGSLEQVLDTTKVQAMGLSWAG